MRFLLVDDHALVRAGVAQLLASHFEAEITEAASFREGLTQFERSSYELAILDVSLPGRGGLELLSALKERQPKLPVLMLSMHSEEQFAVRAIRGGASGYLTKSAAPAEVIAAVEKLLSGGRYLTATLAEHLAAALQGQVGAEGSGVQKLSDRELEVLRLLAAGKNGKEVADELSISFKTVSTYRTRILAKLNLRTTAELLSYAVRLELG